MDSVMKELRGAMPPRIFGLEPPQFSSYYTSSDGASVSRGFTCALACIYLYERGANRKWCAFSDANMPLESTALNMHHRCGPELSDSITRDRFTRRRAVILRPF